MQRMKISALLTACLLGLSAEWAAAQSGMASLRVRCDGGPGGAEPYELAVVATVRQGWLRAERLRETDASTLILEVQIGADARA